MMTVSGNLMAATVSVRKRRARRYKREDTRCAKHPDTKACRSTYVSQGRRRCNWCVKHRADGSPKPNRKRSSKITSNKNRYRKMMLGRKRYGASGNRLFGLKLFERVTGMSVT
jgi:hypothetical protein